MTASSERVAGEVASLRCEPEPLREKWSEAVETYGAEPTAQQVREVVRGATSARREPRSGERGAQAAIFSRNRSRAA